LLVIAEFSHKLTTGQKTWLIEGSLRGHCPGTDPGFGAFSEATMHGLSGNLEMQRPIVVGGLTPLQLRRVRDSIDARLGQDISLAQLAGDCGLSTSHFARAFARSTGIPPHRWLTRRRVERAKELMYTDATLAEIALMCGFSDQSHLTRVFAQVVGVTPGRWRGSRHSLGLHATSIARQQDDAR
jgi:AraC family transcriptional regulator